MTKLKWQQLIDNLSQICPSYKFAFQSVTAKGISSKYGRLLEIRAVYEHPVYGRVVALARIFKCGLNDTRIDIPIYLGEKFDKAFHDAVALKEKEAGLL